MEEEKKTRSEQLPVIFAFITIFDIIYKVPSVHYLVTVDTDPLHCISPVKLTIRRYYLYKILLLFSSNVSLPLQFWRWHIMLLARAYHFFTNDIACDIMRLKTYGVNMVHLMQDNSQITSIQTVNSNK